MSDARIGRWARRFVGAGAAFFLLFWVGQTAGWGRRSLVVLGLYGFVLHVLFGKAYALVPAYFDRSLAVPWAPALQLPLSTLGTAGLALGTPTPVGRAGGLCWAAGTAVFCVAMGWTIRTNPTGVATGTGDTDAHREPVDRLANAVVPVALAYLLVAALAVAARGVGSPWFLPAQVSHLLGAGTAALFVFGVGFRLFPRFLATEPPRPLVRVVLAAGALAPALLAAGLYRRPLLLVGGTLEALAVVGFALAFATMVRRSERRRVGFVSVLVAVGFGVVGVGLGLAAALSGRPARLVGAHYRTMIAGFLGLTVVGATFQFYPPAVGRGRLATDRTARVTIWLLAGGLALALVGTFGSRPLLAWTGALSGLAGATLYTWLLGSAFRRATS